MVIKNFSFMKIKYQKPSCLVIRTAGETGLLADSISIGTTDPIEGGDPTAPAKANMSDDFEEELSGPSAGMAYDDGAGSGGDGRGPRPFGSLWAWGVVFCCTALWGCSDMPDVPSVRDGGTTGGHECHVTAGISSGTGGTRSMTEDGQNFLHSFWESGDECMVYNLSDNEKSEETSYSILKSRHNGKKAFFEGTLKSVKTVKAGDKLAFFYPGGITRDTLVARPVIDKTKKTEEKDLNYDFSTAIRKCLLIDISDQDGTAETIGEKYDLQWACASPKSVSADGKSISVDAGTLKRKISIWGLQLREANSEHLADSVYITFAASSSILDLETGELLTDDSRQLNIVMRPKDHGKYDLNAGWIYAAVFPGAYSDILVTVFNDGKAWSRHFESSLRFVEGNVHRSKLRDFQEDNPHPYVEVQGVKWATGNFIHYVDPNYEDVNFPGGEYWGIAPAQWYISGYADDYTFKGEKNGKKYKGSQYGAYPLTNLNDKDLFAWGAIRNADKYMSNSSESHFKWTPLYTPLDSKKFYNRSKKETTDMDDVYYGDVVWFHTKDNKQKYRIPTREEMRKLLNEADVFAGYCISDKGIKIYGAYFQTHHAGGNRIVRFPTKNFRYDYYINVTALVRAGKGLFLPFTGTVAQTEPQWIWWRCLFWGVNCYGLYMSTFNESLGFYTGYKIGVQSFNEAGSSPKADSHAIRPVWDDSSVDGGLDPTYEPFKHMK